MDDLSEVAKGRGHSQPNAPLHQDFLFVDAAQAKTSRQGRRNARSFVMQKARRERPWSTSKHAAKQRKTGSPENISPKSGTADSVLVLTPNTATPSPPSLSTKPDYFSSMELSKYTTVKGEVCPECLIFLCRPGQKLCPRCFLLKPAIPAEDPNIRLFDPFRTSSVEINESVSELLDHCKSWLLVSINNTLASTEHVVRLPWLTATQTRGMINGGATQRYLSFFNRFSHINTQTLGVDS